MTKPAHNHKQSPPNLPNKAIQTLIYYQKEYAQVFSTQINFFENQTQTSNSNLQCVNKVKIATEEGLEGI